MSYRFGSQKLSLFRGLVLLVVGLIAMVVKFNWVEIFVVFIGLSLSAAALFSRRSTG